MADRRAQVERVVLKAGRRALETRNRVQDAYYRRAGLTLRGRGLTACGVSTSDAYVFKEIFGREDAYRLDLVLPLVEGGTVVEVGAHKGYFTILAGSVAERVLVFEPDVRNHEYVVRNVALNGLQNVVAVRAAVTDRSGTRQFTISDRTDARHTFFRSDYSGAGRIVDVPCVSLQEALEQHEVAHVDLLKLDCEGSEYDVLLAADGETLGRVSNIVAELHEGPTIPHTRDELLGHLARHGFTAHLYDDRTRGDLRTCMAFFSRAA